jgi:hypothetical protein
MVLTTNLNSIPRIVVACLLVLVLSGLFIFLASRAYDELTQPSSVPDRLEPWPARAATLCILILWSLFVPFVATVISRAGRITSKRVVIFAFVVLVIGAVPLLALLSHINTCNTEIGFPFETRC